jgi:hypothetical protein
MNRIISAISLFVVLSFNAAAQLATTTSLVGTISDSSGKVSERQGDGR